jgi:hypothetical protein
MHTFLKRENGLYAVGQWLINPEGYQQFNAMFTVPSLKQAFRSVSMLNGGDYREALIEYQEIKEEV